MKKSNKERTFGEQGRKQNEKGQFYVKDVKMSNFVLSTNKSLILEVSLKKYLMMKRRNRLIMEYFVVARCYTNNRANLRKTMMKTTKQRQNRIKHTFVRFVGCMGLSLSLHFLFIGLVRDRGVEIARFGRATISLVKSILATILLVIYC